MAVSRRDRSTRLLVIGLIVTSLLTITLDFRSGDGGPLATLGRISLEVISPLQEAVSKVFRPIGSFFTDITRVGSIKAENAQLKDQIEEMQSQQGQYQALLRENQELQGLIELQERHALETVGARVIAEGVSNFEWSMTIDKGSSDGIGVDMPVLGPEGLAGVVVRVGSSSSIVRLVIDPASSVSARLAVSGERGILRGQRDKLLFDLAEFAQPVEPGERVETSGMKSPGLESLFPPGIPVGEVSQVIPDESGLEREIFVRPVVDFSRLSVVSVVLAEQFDPADFLPDED